MLSFPFHLFQTHSRVRWWGAPTSSCCSRDLASVRSSVRVSAASASTLLWLQNSAASATLCYCTRARALPFSRQLTGSARRPPTTSRHDCGAHAVETGADICPSSSLGLDKTTLLSETEGGWLRFVQVVASSASNNYQNYHLGPSLLLRDAQASWGFLGGLSTDLRTLQLIYRTSSLFSSNGRMCITGHSDSYESKAMITGNIA